MTRYIPIKLFLSLGKLFLLFMLLSSCKKGEDSTAVNNSGTNNPTPTAAKKFLALGDSYTIGQSVSEADRFPNQTVRLLKEKGIDFSQPRIIATTGWATGDLLNATNNTNIQTDYDAVTLLIGVNNQYQGRSQAEYRAEFSTLLNRAIQYAGNKVKQVYVLSIPDYSVTPFAAGSDKPRIAREIDEFNAINKEIALAAGVHYIDITSISRETDTALIAFDGLHPSGKQYGRWAEMLKQIIN